MVCFSLRSTSLIHKFGAATKVFLVFNAYPKTLMFTFDNQMYDLTIPFECISENSSHYVIKFFVNPLLMLFSSHLIIVVKSMLMLH